MSEEKKTQQNNNKAVKNKHNRHKVKNKSDNNTEKSGEAIGNAKDFTITKASADEKAGSQPKQPVESAGQTDKANKEDKTNTQKSKNRPAVHSKPAQVKNRDQNRTRPENTNKNQPTVQTQGQNQKNDSSQSQTANKTQDNKPAQNKNKNKNQQEAAESSKTRKTKNAGNSPKKHGDKVDKSDKKQPTQFSGEFTDFSESSVFPDKHSSYTYSDTAHFNKSTLSQGTYEPVKSDIEYGKDAPFTDFSTAFCPSGIEKKPDDTLKNDASSARNNSEVNVESCIVIGIKFRSSGKIYYFDPDGIEYKPDTFAIVETARGIEYGYVALGNHPVPITSVVGQLRKAIRPATKADKEHFAENCKKESEAAAIWTQKVAQHGLSMKLVDVEYTFDNSKLLFHFTAEGRIDFRDLVKDLASLFRCRIELRQMGIRDEAKVLGGLGICGRPLCCATFLPDFAQVSIKMAKEQTISLNSAKISGNCGRLMCCLRYEHETYSEANKRIPAANSLVDTPQGKGVIVESKPLLELVKVKLDSNPDAIPSVFRLEEISVIKRVENHLDDEDE